MRHARTLAALLLLLGGLAPLAMLLAGCGPLRVSGELGRQTQAAAVRSDVARDLLELRGSGCTRAGLDAALVARGYSGQELADRASLVWSLRAAVCPGGASEVVRPVPEIPHQ